MSLLNLVIITAEADEHIYCRDALNEENWTLTATPGAQLNVTDLHVETQQSVKEGDSVTLTCNSSCSLPQKTTFIWYKNTQRLTTGTMKENQLQLQSVSRDDAGNYQCAVSGYEHLISPPVYFNVIYPPQSVSVSISPSGVIVEGDSVTLSCSSDSNPPGDFTWFKGGQYAGSGRIYSVSNISSDHSGEYKCRSRNKHGVRYSDVVILNVMYAPRNVVVALNSSAEIVEGGSVTLTCSSDSNPPGDFTWFKGGQYAGSQRIYGISRISSDHSGEYKCRSRNKYGEKYSDVVILNVMYAPRNVVVVLNSSGVIVEGDSVTLSCSSDSNPPGDFTWFKGGQYAGSRRIYSVSNISSDHSGDTECRFQK
ncbi:hypothetical protein cypCar_00047265 [Cyprinus carpio]|nr:hypothetical protein cypCar_00047265 [Cyprinus carpio]